MIGIILNGRLGNQLFQYAFAYTAAKKLKTGFYVDKSIEQFLLPKYFNLPDSRLQYLDQLFTIKGYKNFFSYYARRRFYKLIRQIYNPMHVRFHNELYPEDELKKIGDNVLFEGYFQSEKYFEDEKDSIKRIFKIKENYVGDYLTIRSQLPKDKKIAAVHVRKGDYKNLSFYLPMAYYHEAIKAIDQQDYHFFFLSDEPKEIENDFNYILNKTISSYSEIIDFQFLMNADVCILSNSSFSWWAAYLNVKNPLTYVPKNWMNINNEEYPKDVIPKEWKQLTYEI